MTADHKQLAERARHLAGHAPHSPGGSLDRRAALCCAVALAESGTIPAARKLLDQVKRDDIRTRAGEILGQLLTTEERP